MLKTTNAVSRTSKIYHLNPFIDDRGIIRIDTRLRNSNVLTDTEKFPALISSESHAIVLLILYIHVQNCHSTTLTTICTIRDKYWLIKARQSVKYVVHNHCLPCRRLRVRSYQETPGPLPIHRIDNTLNRAFLSVGIDYVGPFYIKLYNETKKHYILVITCTTTRAVHLEITNCLTASATRIAIMQFTYRRGIPKHIYSDNAAYFVTVSKDIAPSLRLQWHFITERAPWHGGFWERLMSLIRKPLRIMHRDRVINFDEFQLVVLKTEAVLNSRPITYITADNREDVPLTPAHFLIGGSLLTPPCHVSEQNDVDIADIFDRHSRASRDFYERWRAEYLRFLAVDRRRYLPKVPQVGHVVLIDNDKAQHLWPIGVVTRLFKSGDGKCRSVEVLTKQKYIRRPIQKLYNLELNSPAPEC